MVPKYRGKTIKGLLVVGYVSVVTDKRAGVEPGTYISNSVGFPFAYEVDPKTVGQSTGLKDKNGVEIFEGDVVRYTWDMLSDVNATEKGKKVRISKVFWSDWRASWAVGKKSCNNDLFRYARNGNTVEVIGNVWENPNLLEQANEN